MLAIIKKELRSYFSSPLGYVCMALILALFGFYYYQVMLIGSSFYISSVYSTMFIWCMMIIPILTMRSFSEERKNRTDQALLTAPVGTFSIVLGKFIASFGVFFATLCVSLLPALIIGMFTKISWGLVLGSWFGALLYGAAMAAIGLFISALTESQVIAAIGTFGAAVMLLVIDQLNSVVQVPALQTFFGWISFNSRYTQFTGGSFNFASIVFFLSVAALFLFFTARKLEGRRQSKHLAGRALCAGVLVAAVLVNVVFSALVLRFPSMNIDTSANGMNSLSTAAQQVVDKVNKPTTMIITLSQIQAEADPTYKQVSVLTAKMAERNRNITVRYADLEKEPALISQYKADNLTSGSVVIQTEGRSRVVAGSDMFTPDYQTGVTTSNVDGALASGLNYVMAESLPIVAMEVGHAALLDSAEDYQKILNSNGFETTSFNLVTEEIPANTQLLVLAGPTSDYSEAEIKKLSAYLSSTTQETTRSLLVGAHAAQGELPRLAAFLQEWGIGVEPAMVLEGSQDNYYNGQPNLTRPIAGADVDLQGAKTYEYLAMPNANPVKILFTSRNDRQTFSLMTTTAGAYLYDVTTGVADETNTDTFNLGVLSQQIITADSGKKPQANVVVLGSLEMLTAQYMSAPLSNLQYLLDLSHYATGTVGSSTAVVGNSVAAISHDIAMSSGVALVLGVGVFMLLIPISLLVTGLVVFLKRRHL